MSRLYRKSDYNRAVLLSEESNPGRDHPWRSPFRRDYARLIHCPSLRRLQGKTQLFAGLESDFFRNRLTHSLEVAQIAKSIALHLNYRVLDEEKHPIDVDLMEFAGLAHDLGHPPFGHTGERALNRLMRGYGGFEGNAQTLRILTRLEKKLDAPKRQLLSDSRGRWYNGSSDLSIGLNLCSRTLASILKYDHEINYAGRAGTTKLQKGYYHSEADVTDRVKADVGNRSGRKFKTIECQIMDLADDIAYSTYDIEDTFKGGLSTPLDLLFVEDKVLTNVAERTSAELQSDIRPADVKAALRAIFKQLSQQPKAAPSASDWDWYLTYMERKYAASKRYARDGFLRTTLTSTIVGKAISAIHVTLDSKFPALSQVKMADDIRLEIAVLKHLSYVLLISSNRFKVVAYRGERIVEEIFRALAEEEGHELLPQDFAERYEQGNKAQRYRVICDFIAGMTDRYAIEFYSRLTSENFQTMFKPYD